MNWNTKSLVRLYPPEWRERYADEFLALLEQRPYTFGNWIDVLLGAIDANLRPQISDNFNPALNLITNRLRTSIMVGFCAYIAFIVAGLAFYGMLDDSPFIPAMQGNFEFRSAWFTVECAAVIALLAVTIGGLPLVLAVLRQGVLAKRRDLLLLLFIPVVAFVGLISFWIGTALILALFGLEGKAIAPIFGSLLLCVWGTAFVIAAIFSVGSVWVALARSRVNVRFYRFARVPTVVATIAMAIMLVGTLAWGLLADLQVHAAFVDSLLGWLLIVATMAIATVVAGVVSVRATAIA